MAIDISESVWAEVDAALKTYLSALVLYWRSPNFDPAHVHAFSADRKLVETKADSTAHRLPNLGEAVRGLPGTKVTVSDKESVPTVWSAMNPSRWRSVDESSPEVVQVSRRREAIKIILENNKLLCRGIHLISWGPGALEKFEETEAAAATMFEPHFMELGRIQMLLGAVLHSRVGGIEALPTIEYDPTIVDEVIARLRAAFNAEHFPFSVTALLNSPPIDSRSMQLFEGQWYDRPFVLTIGFPDDAFVTDVVNGVGHGALSWGPDHLYDVNSYLRIDFELPSTITSEDMVSAHASAAEYLREAVDVLRLVHPDDIGIVWLSGSARSSEKKLRLTPPFVLSFRERPNQMYRVPMRRVYDPPSGEPLSAVATDQFGLLFKKYSIDRIKISGLPIAMERLRGIYDRYAPDEVGRMIDAVTGLEALYLPEKQGELKFRLQHRAAWFLEPEAEERVSLVGELGEVYDARSALVHSGELSKKLKKRDSALMQSAVAILRRSILHFLSTEFGVGTTATQLSEKWLDLTLGKRLVDAVHAVSSDVLPMPGKDDEIDGADD